MKEITTLGLVARPENVVVLTGLLLNCKGVEVGWTDTGLTKGKRKCSMNKTKESLLLVTVTDHGDYLLN